MVIPGSSDSLQAVHHTLNLIDVPFANVYLDSQNCKGHCKEICVSSPLYPVIVGNVRGACEMLPDPDRKAETREKLVLGPVHVTTMTVTTKVVISLVESKRATRQECVAGPVLTRAQAKNTEKIHPLKVKEDMSNVDKSAIEDLQKKCFD